MKNIIYLVIVLLLFSCDKYLDITPKGQVIPQTTADFRKLLDKGYAKAPSGNSSMTSINPSFKSDIALRSDELMFREGKSIGSELLSVFSWEEVTATFSNSVYPYIEFYESIFYTNEVINSGKVRMPDSEEKKQILAEAYALRAYNFFNLVNMYAVPYNKSTAKIDKGIPIVTKTNLEQTFPKQSVERVYDQIISDIQNSLILMNIVQQDKSKGLHYRFSKSSLDAFASRVYLYMGEFQKSVDFANRALKVNSEIVDLKVNPAVSPVSEDSAESLMALDGLMSLYLRLKVFVSDEMISKFNQDNDLRINLYLFKRGDNYIVRKREKCSFRVSELYLNKSESLARLGEYSEAKKVLLMLMRNRYKNEYIPLLEEELNQLQGDDLINQIVDERARELIFEGHRWFDLRRTSQKEILHVHDGKTYKLKEKDSRYTIPFPQSAVQENPLLNN